MVEELASGVLVVSYVYGTSLDPISMNRDTNGSPSSLESNIYLADGHSGVRQAITAVGSVILAAYRFDAFGNKVASAGSVEPILSDTGASDSMRRWGSTTCRHRFYDPRSGRFTGADALDASYNDPLQAMHYGYAGMNTVGNIDPSGLFFGGFVSFSLGNTLRGLAISTVTTGITYVLSDVIAKLALNFVPLEIQSRLNTLDSAVPDAILGGITGSLTIGTGGISGGFVGGMELLVSPNTGRAAAYWYWRSHDHSWKYWWLQYWWLGLTFGQCLSRRDIQSAPTSLDYQGPFDSVTLPTGFLLGESHACSE